MPYSKENFTRALYEAYPETVVFCDGDGVIRGLNAAGCQAFGYDGGEIVGQHLSLLHADAAEYRFALEHGFLSQSPKTIHDLVFRYCRKDRSEFHGQLTGSRVIGEDGMPEGYIGVIRDVTHILTRDSRRRALTLATDAALDAVPVGFAIFDENETLILYNRAYREMCGAAADSIFVGATLNDILSANMAAGNYLDCPPESPAAAEWLERRRQNNRTPSGPDVFRHGDDRWIRSESLKTPNGHIVSLRIDVTDLKAQQDRLAEQTTELQRKNEALNQFTATVSHDLKAPLRHLSMFSDMIAEDVAAGQLDELPVYAQHLGQSARRMDQLINSLLEYARIVDQITNWQQVSLAEVVREAIANLDSFISEAGAIIDIGALPRVRGDVELLKCLCQNLIGNAVKYRREGVVPIVKIYGEARKGIATLVVEDNGIGVDPRYAAKIFDVFQRLHRDDSHYPGTGIGLSLAKRIAESHKGSIELDASFEDGARFVVTLPASPKQGG
ncbi:MULTISPECIES: ATP-binding protein [unclassified Rhizobium]|uniref:ATP-binding protein n=1 Tax=unclassified Rhizobium TaxID=2613769 RepID=UPI0006F43411|nr:MULTISPECIES: ATP-binding protein [unclassified Rhizobium]KQV34345.1 hypothetical protein ASC86_15525 [Rhizobium sp. Root1212]KRD23723.1 hypothetical protein ASE37_15515 [Rhizobium sp. Root268]